MLLLLDDLLGLLSPHICKRCGVVGSTYCKRCIYDVAKQPYSVCLNCRGRCSLDNLCPNCHKALSCFTRLISIAPRQGSLKHLVDGYKFHSEVASAQVLARLIDLRLGDLSAETVIVPIPTVASHIRERGFDHMLLVAKQLAGRRQLMVADRILTRTDNLSQHRLSALDRRRLISKSLVLSPAYDQPVNDDIPRSVLLLDDIWTTGSTMIRAARLLKSAGVRHITAVAILTQPK